jgi:hypothetical protein
MSDRRTTTEQIEQARAVSVEHEIARRRMHGSAAGNAAFGGVPKLPSFHRGEPRLVVCNLEEWTYDRQSEAASGLGQVGNCR